MTSIIYYRCRFLKYRSRNIKPSRRDARGYFWPSGAHTHVEGIMPPPASRSIYFSSLSILPLSLSLSFTQQRWGGLRWWPVLPGSGGRAGSAFPLHDLTGRGVNDGPTASYPLPDPAVAHLPWQWQEWGRTPSAKSGQEVSQRQPDGALPSAISGGRGGGDLTGSARWWWRHLSRQQEHKGLMCFLSSCCVFDAFWCVFDVCVVFLMFMCVFMLYPDVHVYELNVVYNLVKPMQRVTPYHSKPILLLFFSLSPPKLASLNN